MQNQLTSVLQQYSSFHPVVPFDRQSDKLLLLDFTAANSELTPELLGDIQLFTQYVHDKLHREQAHYGIGGYGEHRTIYSRSEVFDRNPQPFYDHQSLPAFFLGAAKRQRSLVAETTGDQDDYEDAPALKTDPVAEPRRLHLGTDIWGPLHTKVMAPLDGIVHSFGFHPELGNYGTVIILAHQLAGQTFYTLYGHLSYGSIRNLREGQRIVRGEVFAEFGIQQDNGWWPPHLHFQVIQDLQGWKGDYPGVCAYSQRAQWLNNCVDPDLILGMMKFAQ